MKDDYIGLTRKIELAFLRVSIVLFLLSVGAAYCLNITKPKEVIYKHKSTRVKEDAPWNKDKKL